MHNQVNMPKEQKQALAALFGDSWESEVLLWLEHVSLPRDCPVEVLYANQDTGIVSVGAKSDSSHTYALIEKWQRAKLSCGRIQRFERLVQTMRPNR